jgi:hypothetical protein
MLDPDSDPKETRADLDGPKSYGSEGSGTLLPVIQKTSGKWPTHNVKEMDMDTDSDTDTDNLNGHFTKKLRSMKALRI